MKKNPHAVALGKLGGSVSSKSKTAAVRENARQPRPNGRKPRKPRTGKPAHRKAKPAPKPARGKTKPGSKPDKYPGMTRPF